MRMISSSWCGTIGSASNFWCASSSPTVSRGGMLGALSFRFSQLLCQEFDLGCMIGAARIIAVFVLLSHRTVVFRVDVFDLLVAFSPVRIDNFQGSSTAVRWCTAMASRFNSWRMVLKKFSCDQRHGQAGMCGDQRRLAAVGQATADLASSTR